MQTEWKPEEDADLCSCVGKSKSWYDTSSKLWKMHKYQTKRTPFDCKRRFLQLKSFDPFPSNKAEVPINLKRSFQETGTSSDGDGSPPFKRAFIYSSPSPSSSSPPSPDHRMSVFGICNQNE